MKEQAIENLKTAVRVSQLVGSIEAVAVGVLKCVDALSAIDEKQCTDDINDAAALIMSILVSGLVERYNCSAAMPPEGATPEAKFLIYCKGVTEMLHQADETAAVNKAIEILNAIN